MRTSFSPPALAAVVLSLSAAAGPVAAQEAPRRLTPSPAAQTGASDPFPSDSNRSGALRDGTTKTTLPGALQSLLPTIGQDLLRLPSIGTAVVLGAGGALALAVRPVDLELTRRATVNQSLDAALEAGSPIGSGYAQVGAAFGTLLVSHAIGNPRMQAVGFDLVRAQAVNAILTQGIKVAAGRRRPDGARFSFPSGHASASFATAAVLHRHFGWKAGIPAYAAAAGVAGSRLQENRHFASDVIFGAAVGVAAGRAVTIGRGKARFAMAPMAVPGGGMGISFAHVGDHARARMNGR